MRISNDDGSITFFYDYDSGLIAVETLDIASEITVLSHISIDDLVEISRLLKKNKPKKPVETY